MNSSRAKHTHAPKILSTHRNRAPTFCQGHTPPPSFTQGVAVAERDEQQLIKESGLGRSPGLSLTPKTFTRRQRQAYLPSSRPGHRAFLPKKKTATTGRRLEATGAFSPAPGYGAVSWKVTDLTVLLKYDIQHSVMCLIILKPWRSVLPILAAMEWCTALEICS